MFCNGLRLSTSNKENDDDDDDDDDQQHEHQSVCSLRRKWDTCRLTASCFILPIKSQPISLPDESASLHQNLYGVA